MTDDISNAIGITTSLVAFVGNAITISSVVVQVPDVTIACGIWHVWLLVVPLELGLTISYG